MTDSDIQAWRDADQLFARLLDLPAEQRQQHLHATEVPQAVRQRAEQLLAMATQVPPWLQRIEQQGGMAALSGNAADSEPGSALIGRQIGRWQWCSGRAGPMAPLTRRRR